MKLIRFLCIPLFLLLVLLMRWKGNIRIGEIWSNRLGHLIGNTECYLAEREAGIHKDFIDIWYSRDVSANTVIQKKYNKLLHTVPTWLGYIIRVCNRFFSGWEKHEVDPLQYDRDFNNYWKHPYLSFTFFEEWKGRRLLKKLGIKGKWVCLMVRDEMYLKEKGEFNYHDYRDSDIDSYGPAVLELLERGYTVVRMSVKVSKPLKIKHSRFIDYAWEGKRTEFADLYLGAKCEFAVGTACGFMSIPQAFERPIVYVNHAPLEYVPVSQEKALLIWKHHIKDGKRMTLEEIFKCGAGQFTAGPDFAKLGITLEDNTTMEIVDAVVEMADNYPNVPWKGLQPEFWSKFPIDSISPFNGRKLHGRPGMRIGKEFLKTYD